MASLVVGLPAEVAHAPEMSAAESFSQSSTRVEKASEAPPAAANVAQTTVAAPAVTPPNDTEAKPSPPAAADGSTAAGSPADSEKAPPAAVAAALDAAAAAPAPPKPKPLVAAPLLDPPRTYEKDAKTIRALISLARLLPLFSPSARFILQFPMLHRHPTRRNQYNIITRSRTPPRAPASTCPGQQRPARPGARTPA